MRLAILFSALMLLLTAVGAFAQPVISVYPDELNFSPTPLEEDLDVFFTITNRGDEDLVISEMNITGDFYCAFDNDVRLQPGVIAEFVVTFTPAAAGERLGRLTIHSNDPRHPEFAMHLKGWGGEWRTEQVYDNNNASGAYQGSADECEAVCFSPAHPCRLESFRFRPRGTGQMECHVWGDDGAHEPDLNEDLIEPFIVNVQNDQNWMTIDLSDSNVIFNPPRDFHIGFKLLGDSPSLWLDGTTPIQERSHIYSFAQSMNQWQWMIFSGNHCNFMLRATMQYLSVADHFTFRDVSQRAGIGGISKAAWGDYDNDGWEDLLVNGCRLYRNNRNGSFTDVSATAGIVEGNPAHTGTWGDFDNDGWLDFISLLGGISDDRLYRNNGDGTFEFVNARYYFRNVDNPTAAVGWGDCNNDGYLDVHVANSEDWNNGNPIYYRDVFYLFSTDFESFINRTPEDLANRFYYGRSVAWCDFNMDGWMDYYLSNYRLQPNFLLVNQGDGSFRDEAAARGNLQGYNVQGYYGHTIGSAWADIDNDLDFDLLVGNFAHPWGLWYQDKIMLMRNDGAESEYTFTDIFASSGIKYCETVFCPAFADYDNDGWQDVFISSVYDGRQPFMYHSVGDGASFENVNYETGFHGICYNSYGVSWCDYDHDGDLDAAIGNGGLFENTTWHSYNWAQFVLHGASETVNKFAFGSKAFVYCGDRHYLRQVEGGSGAESCQNAATLHFGLGEAQVIDSLVIDWIGGGEERYYDLAVNTRYEVTEGEGILSAPDELEHAAAPIEFGLAAVYPNPFNSEVRIDYVLSVAGRVQLKVYDLSGRLVMDLMDRMDAAGRHSLAWKAEGMPTGVYFLRLEAGEQVATKKIAMVK